MLYFINDGEQALVELVHVCVRRVDGLVEGVRLRMLILLLVGWKSLLHHLLRRRSVFLVQ